jgi:hypothetical protein
MKIEPRHTGAIVFSIWALVAGGLLYFSSGTPLISFDANGVLGQKAASMDFDQRFTGWLQAQGLATTGTVIHIIDTECPCFSISEPHRQSVAALAQTNGFNNQFLSWRDDIKSWVPASPAVVVFSQKGQLTYYGPYSSGAFCTADNGLVEPFIKEQQQSLPGAVIVTDAVGCYCNYQKG